MSEIKLQGAVSLIPQRILVVLPHNVTVSAAYATLDTPPHSMRLRLCHTLQYYDRECALLNEPASLLMGLAE